MALKQVLSLAAAVTVFVLSLTTLLQIPIVVEAVDCTAQGDNFGLFCRDAFGPSYLCQQCVAWDCYNFNPNDGECIETCANQGTYICYYGT